MHNNEKLPIARILIIDDDIHVLAMLRKMLEREGYEIVVALDGNEGLRLYRENPTKLIITDLIMPEKEGLETIIELRQNFPDTRIIAMSGGGQ
ncbi:MAG: response regulator, partial [Desulfobacterales bacterium]|nr:response regulator [Desulfobacterales bacterium]